MAKRRFQLNAEEARRLNMLLNECKDCLLRTRLQAILLFGTGTPIIEIQFKLGCSRASIMNWCQAYRSKGLEGLIDQRRGGNRARLRPDQLQELTRLIKTHTPQMFFGQPTTVPRGQDWTIEDLYWVVKHWYGIVYQSRTSYYNLFNRCRFDR